MSSDINKMSRKKPHFSIIEPLRLYLHKYGREQALPVNYSDLLNYEASFPQTDRNGDETLWETVMYNPEEMKRIYKGLCIIYSLLKLDEDENVLEHLTVSRVDYCTFGNSNPFRIRIVNKFNDNYDYFYVKTADASRVYGLEFEHILSPNRINYMVDERTLIEEHIAGIPGDAFMKTYMQVSPTFNKVRLAKEFVKFNERCFVKLLGDMRSYNYVVDITPDFENEQYRIRAIDFDQQCYEGRKSLYLPQYFKENNPIVELCVDLLNVDTVRQYQFEEHTVMNRRVRTSKRKMLDLIQCMRKDKISSEEKMHSLREELAEFHKNKNFLRCFNMGDLLRQQLKSTLLKPKRPKAL